jgi:hypothetical protein
MRWHGRNLVNACAPRHYSPVHSCACRTLCAVRPGTVAGARSDKGLIVRTARIKDHASFRPAADYLRAYEAIAPTPPGDPVATAALAQAKAALQRHPRQDTAPLVAQAWGVTPRAVRRNVLNLAGLDPNRWESPIHSFTDSERIAMRAAANRAVRAYESVLNAV